MKNKYTKEEVIKLLKGADITISKYENNIRLEKERIKRIQEKCSHEWVESSTQYNMEVCLICGSLRTGF